MSTHDLLQTEAVLDEEEDESFGEEGGQSKDVEENGHYDDSSEEELDDEDEDAVRAVGVLPFFGFNLLRPAGRGRVG